MILSLQDRCNLYLMLKSCLDVCRPGGWVVWLDQVLPMFGKETCTLAMAIGMVKSTNHRVRGVFGFRRNGDVLGQ